MCDDVIAHLFLRRCDLWGFVEQCLVVTRHDEIFGGWARRRVEGERRGWREVEVEVAKGRGREGEGEEQT